MSTDKQHVPLALAQNFAQHALEHLAPHCDRIEVAGSVRREKALVGDIEIVCIPKRVAVRNLFGDVVGLAPIPEFQAAIDVWHKVKGSPAGRYTKRLLPNGFPCDVFMCHDYNWGNTLLIRTGSADWTSKVLIPALAKNMCRFEDGLLWVRGETAPALEEVDVFAYARMAPVPPQEREHHG